MISRDFTYAPVADQPTTAPSMAFGPIERTSELDPLSGKFLTSVQSSESKPMAKTLEGVFLAR